MLPSHGAVQANELERQRYPRVILHDANRLVEVASTIWMTTACRFEAGAAKVLWRTKRWACLEPPAKRSVRIYFSGASEGEVTINFSSSEACSKCRPAADRKMWAECGSLMSRANSRQCSACWR
jgi:hypothetical protein